MIASDAMEAHQDDVVSSTQGREVEGLDALPGFSDDESDMLVIPETPENKAYNCEFHLLHEDHVKTPAPSLSCRSGEYEEEEEGRVLRSASNPRERRISDLTPEKIKHGRFKRRRRFLQDRAVGPTEDRSTSSERQDLADWFASDFPHAGKHYMKYIDALMTYGLTMDFMVANQTGSQASDTLHTLHLTTAPPSRTRTHTHTLQVLECIVKDKVHLMMICHNLQRKFK